MKPELYASVVKPTLILDGVRARANIARMAASARRQGLRFRPHFKTHQSAEIGEWFRAEGVTQITASSVDMAHYFADHGWDDITIAFPANVREIDRINDLAARVRLNLLVESVATVQRLDAQLTAPVGAWIEADAGNNRSGVPWNDGATLHDVASAVTNSTRLSLQGLLTHAGNTYAARSHAEIERIHWETVKRMQRMREWLMEYGFLGLEISIGDTPACSVLADLGDVDEMRPGNFVFYDLTQVEIGSCGVDDVAVIVACPVVAVHRERGEIVLYGGAVHLSKDFLPRADGSPSYGAVVRLTDKGWSEPVAGAWLRSLSQEHGVVRMDGAAAVAALADMEVGDLLGVLPVHSCLTADLLKRYRTLDGLWLEMAPIPAWPAG